MILVIGERANFRWMVGDSAAGAAKMFRCGRNWRNKWFRFYMRGGSLERLKKFIPEHIVVNLLPPDGIRGTWDQKLAEDMVKEVRGFLTGGSQYAYVVLLGRRLTDLFFGKGMPFGHIGKIGSLPALSLPHPSGINRWWHRPEAMDDVKLWVKNLLEN